LRIADCGLRIADFRLPFSAFFFRYVYFIAVLIIDFNLDKSAIRNPQPAIRNQLGYNVRVNPSCNY